MSSAFNLVSTSMRIHDSYFFMDVYYGDTIDTPLANSCDWTNSTVYGDNVAASTDPFFSGEGLNATQEGLTLIVDGSYPSDAPQGTESRGPYGAIFMGPTSQWREEGGAVRLRYSAGSLSVVPEIIPTYYENENVVVIARASGSDRIVRIQGEVVMAVTSGTVDSAVFPVDALLQVLPGGTTSFVSGGGSQTPSYETNVGVYTCDLVADTGNPEGFHVEVALTSGSSQPIVSAFFRLTESEP